MLLVSRAERKVTRPKTYRIARWMGPSATTSTKLLPADRPVLYNYGFNQNGPRRKNAVGAAINIDYFPKVPIHGYLSALDLSDSYQRTRPPGGSGTRSPHTNGKVHGRGILRIR